MAAEQRKPTKGGVQGLFFLTLWPSDRKNKFCYAAGIYFQFCSPSTLPLIFSPHQASGPAAPGCLEERADCAQQIASHFCNASVLGAGKEALPAAQVTLLSNISYTDAPQCKEWLQPVLPAAENCASLLPERARSSWQQEHFQTTCAVLPAPPPSACSLLSFFFLDTFCVCFGCAAQKGERVTHHFVLPCAEGLLMQDTDPSACDASGRVFKPSH